MNTRGSARMVIWFELDDPAIAPEHDHWHAQEHMFERLGIPGFLRGRRAVSVSAPRRYFVCYEVDDLATLDGEAYRRCLNQPTPWTQRMMPRLRNVTRSLCHVAASAGGGVGAAIGTVRFSPRPGAEASLRAWAAAALPGTARSAGLTGAQLLCSAARARAQGTQEQALRGGNDGEADWVLLVEGYDAAAVRAFLSGDAAAAALERNGAAPGARHDFFALDFTLVPSDTYS